MDACALLFLLPVANSRRSDVDRQTVTRFGHGVLKVLLPYPTVTLSDGHRLTINGLMRFAISFTRCKQPRSDVDRQTGTRWDTVCLRCYYRIPP
jgi:hypothetical protein